MQKSRVSIEYLFCASYHKIIQNLEERYNRFHWILLSSYSHSHTPQLRALKQTAFFPSPPPHALHWHLILNDIYSIILKFSFRPIVIVTGTVFQSWCVYVYVCLYVIY